MQEERLLKRINSYFIVHTLTKVFSFCLVLLYAFYISPSALGEYEYIQTLINIIVPFFFLSIWESVLKFGLREGKYAKEKVIGTSTLITFLCSVVLILTCILWFGFKNVKDAGFIIFVILTYVLDAVVIMWQHYLKILDRYDLYVKSAVLGSITSIVLVLVLTIIFKLQLEALFISSIVGMLLTFILIELKAKIIKYLNRENIDTKFLKEMLKYSFPLTISAGLMWLVTGLSKALVKNYISAEANGLYSFAHKFTIIITFVSTIISTAITEEMLTVSKERFKEEFEKTTEKLIETFFMIATLAIPLIMLFYKVIERTEYYASRKYVAILILYFIFLTITGNITTVFKVYKKNKMNMLATLIGAIITVIALILSFSKFGIMGVVISQLAGALIILIFTLILTMRYIKLNFNYLKIISLLLIYIIVSISTYFSNIYIIILVWVFTLIYFKDNILSILKEYKRSKCEENI